MQKHALVIYWTRKRFPNKWQHPRIAGTPLELTLRPIFRKENVEPQGNLVKLRTQGHRKNVYDWVIRS